MHSEAAFQLELLVVRALSGELTRLRMWELLKIGDLIQ